MNIQFKSNHYSDVIMGAMASQITSHSIIYSTGYSGADQRKHQSYASLAFVRGIHRWPVNSPHKCPVARKMFPFDDVIMMLKRQALCKQVILITFDLLLVIRWKICRGSCWQQNMMIGASHYASKPLQLSIWHNDCCTDYVFRHCV